MWKCAGVAFSLHVIFFQASKKFLPSGDIEPLGGRLLIQKKKPGKQKTKRNIHTKTLFILDHPPFCVPHHHLQRTLHIRLRQSRCVQTSDRRETSSGFAEQARAVSPEPPNSTSHRLRYTLTKCRTGKQTSHLRQCTLRCPRSCFSSFRWPPQVRTETCCSPNSNSRNYSSHS